MATYQVGSGETDYTIYIMGVKDPELKLPKIFFSQQFASIICRGLQDAYNQGDRDGAERTRRNFRASLGIKEDENVNN